MGRRIVQDDDVARPQSRSQLGLDVGFKNAPVHRRVNDEGGGQGVASQASDEGLRLPVSERDFRKQPLPPQAAASQARHLGGRSSLVEKDHPMRLKPHDRLARQGPFLARLLDVGPIAFAGDEGFMEWPAPPSGVVGSLAVQEEEGNGYCGPWRRSRQERLQRGRAGCVRRGRDAA